MRIPSLFVAASLFAATGCGAGAVEEEVEATGSSSLPLRAERHCLAHLSPGDTQRGPAKIGPMTCYGTISEVVSAATGGRVVLPATTRASDLSEEMLAAAANGQDFTTLGAILIGTDYTEPNFGGSSLSWTAPYGCTDRYSGTNYTWYVDSMPAGWDNVVSSAKAHSYCRSMTFYDYTYRGGLGMSTSCNAYSLSFMDNRVSSQVWSPNPFGESCFY